MPNEGHFVNDVNLTIDGLAVSVPAGTTIFDAARVIEPPELVADVARVLAAAAKRYA